LFDREAEVAAIKAGVARALAGDGGVLVVRGPAGIGKTALLRVGGRLAQERGVGVLRARAAPFERGFPFGVVRQLFEPVLARGDLPADEFLAARRRALWAYSATSRVCRWRPIRCSSAYTRSIG
jgi:predicted ATPase